MRQRLLASATTTTNCAALPPSREGPLVCNNVPIASPAGTDQDVHANITPITPGTAGLMRCRPLHRAGPRQIRETTCRICHATSLPKRLGHSERNAMDTCVRPPTCSGWLKHDCTLAVDAPTRTTWFLALMCLVCVRQKRTLVVKFAQGRLLRPSVPLAYENTRNYICVPLLVVL